MVEVAGLKDRTGKLKLEVYPDNDADFLMDDNVLVYQGKTFPAAWKRPCRRAADR
jgi:uncharacterized protein (DUF2141 family)